MFHVEHKTITEVNFMKTNRSIISILMCIALLTGCGGKEEPMPDSVPTEPTDAYTEIASTDTAETTAEELTVTEDEETTTVTALETFVESADNKSADKYETLDLNIFADEGSTAKELVFCGNDNIAVLYGNGSSEYTQVINIDTRQVINRIELNEGETDMGLGRLNPCLKVTGEKSAIYLFY